MAIYGIMAGVWMSSWCMLYLLTVKAKAIYVYIAIMKSLCDQKVMYDSK